jgi:hypothetical protein
MKSNPYRYQGPLNPDADKTVCISRHKDVERVIRGLLKGDYFAIYGPRQSGKTTFLNQIQNVQKNVLFLYVSFEIVPQNETQFYRWLVNMMQEKIPSEPMTDVDKNLKAYGPHLYFSEFLKELKPKKDYEKIVFLFDEIEAFPFLEGFLKTWRKVFFERVSISEFHRYSLAITSTNDLIKLTTEGRGSPFNIADTIYLKDFSDEEAGKLVDQPLKKLNVEIDAGARLKLLTEIGGHPQMLQHACHYLLDIALSEKRNLKEKDVDDAVHHLLLTNTAIAQLEQYVVRDKTHTRLIQDILEGRKVPFYLYRDYAISGAGSITRDENYYCAIRNNIYKRFLVDFLESISEKTVPPAAQETPTAATVKPIFTGTKIIPYGVGGYETLREKNYYYVDKTSYFQHIERAPLYLFFIRPRRFGKTLFLSMLEAYYDISKADRFEQYFAGTHVFEHPTPEKNSYLILKFDFSGINVSEPSAKQIEESFFNHVASRIKTFISKYKEQLQIEENEVKKELETRTNASDLLGYTLNLCSTARQKIYLFIDEYDNFANTILSTAGRRHYEDLTHGKGFFKTFFKVIKTGTSGTDIAIERLFITGVSPITMDDVTSGFNIGENISTDRLFNEMMGFKEEEVVEMIEYYRAAGDITHDTGYLMDVMNRWYNHYRFSKESETRVFNPTLVLYFFKEYFKNQKVPDDLFDDNVKTDYVKLKHLILVDKKGKIGTNGNFSKLKTVIEDGSLQSRLIKSFPLENLERHENFSSLLFYFGILTIESVEEDKSVVLTVPNETVKKLVYEYIRDAYRETGVFHLDMEKHHQLLSGMAFKGEWKPLFDYFSRRMKESMSLRDLISGEKFMQGFLIAYLGQSSFYIIHSEREMNKGYADLVLEPFLAKYEELRYSYIIEIKYLKTSGSGDKEKIAQLKQEAEQQLSQYALDEKFEKTISKTQLVKLVLVFAGHELVHISQVTD